jgi:hypothetical protein
MFQCLWFLAILRFGSEKFTGGLEALEIAITTGAVFSG